MGPVWLQTMLKECTHPSSTNFKRALSSLPWLSNGGETDTPASRVPAKELMIYKHTLVQEESSCLNRLRSKSFYKALLSDDVKIILETVSLNLHLHMRFS